MVQYKLIKITRMLLIEVIHMVNRYIEGDLPTY